MCMKWKEKNICCEFVYERKIVIKQRERQRKKETEKKETEKERQSEKRQKDSEENRNLMKGIKPNNFDKVVREREREGERIHMYYK